MKLQKKKSTYTRNVILGIIFRLKVVLFGNAS